MDSIDYYDRYAVPYYEETVDLSMEEQLERFVELLPESADVLEFRRVLFRLCRKVQMIWI